MWAASPLSPPPHTNSTLLPPLSILLLFWGDIILLLLLGSSSLRDSTPWVSNIIPTYCLICSSGVLKYWVLLFPSSSNTILGVLSLLLCLYYYGHLPLFLTFSGWLCSIALRHLSYIL